MMEAQPAPLKDNSTAPKGVVVFKYALGVVIALSIGFAIYKFWSTSASTSDHPKVVVLDSRKLMSASMKQIMSNNNLSNDQIAVVSEKLAKNMQTLMSEYRAQGFVVMNSNSLLAWPEEVDITAQFADRLGVKID